MADDELDELFCVRPEEFTALRTKLVAAAKKRGDTSAAKRISAARKPTTAAWVVNLLAHSNDDVKQSLDRPAVSGCGQRTPRWTARPSGSCPRSNGRSSTNSPAPRSTVPT